MNEYLFHLANGLAGLSPALDKLFSFLSNDFGYFLIFFLVYFLATHNDKKRGVYEIAVMLAAAVGAWLIAHLIKYFYYHPRPFVALPDINQLISYDSDSSFPSGHATFYSALAMAMYFYHKPVALLLAIGAVIVGLSRIVVGVHWPLDILAGFILGPFISMVFYRLAVFIDKKNKENNIPIIS